MAPFLSSIVWNLFTNRRNRSVNRAPSTFVDFGVEHIPQPVTQEVDDQY